jgi:hypothetical protein
MSLPKRTIKLVTQTAAKSAEQTLAQVAANVLKPAILAFQAISGVHLRKPLFQRSRMVVTNPHEGSDMVFHEFLEPSSLNI